MKLYFRFILKMCYFYYISLSSHKTWRRASGPINLEGACFKPVPLDCFLAQVEDIEAESDAA